MLAGVLPAHKDNAVQYASRARIGGYGTRHQLKKEELPDPVQACSNSKKLTDWFQVFLPKEQTHRNI
jgi:hypothetical protein